MKKKYFHFRIASLITAIIFSFNLNAQIEECGFDAILQQKLLANPVAKQKMIDFETNLLKNKNTISAQAGTIYKIPVVFHVMHLGEPIGQGVNVSEELIKSVLKNVNQNFRKIQGTSGFGNGQDIEIEFVLAVRDPQGNCTNGITRFDMSSYTEYVNNGVNLSSSGPPGISGDSLLKALIVWNQTKYLNIWVINKMQGASGYAFNSSFHGTLGDGVLVDHSLMDYALTHELGHVLNLYHSFEGDKGGNACPQAGNGCGGGIGDCCGDTPPHKRGGNCNASGTNSCDNNTSNSLYISNYMNYFNDGCINEFTQDQKTRMRAALTIDRASFLASNGNMALVPPAAPIVDFEASASVVCNIGLSG